MLTMVTQTHLNVRLFIHSQACFALSFWKRGISEFPALGLSGLQMIIA